MGTYTDPALILPGAVGQTELDAASKKDVANGVAALDAAGALLVPGSKMYYTRDGSDDVHIYERASDEEAYAFHRVGADDYTFYIKESNVWERFQTESMKDIAGGIAGLDGSVKIPVALLKTNVANGVAGLDGSVKIPVALLKTNVANGVAGLDASGDVPDAQLAGLVARSTSDNFNGNNTVNRAIPHGLGCVPKYIYIVGNHANLAHIVINGSLISSVNAIDAAQLAITAADVTNFYVGNATDYSHSANDSTYTFYWVAFS